MIYVKILYIFIIFNTEAVENLLLLLEEQVVYLTTRKTTKEVDEKC